MKAQTVTALRQSSYERPRENFEHIVGYLDSGEASAMSHSELERELEKRGRELMRILLQEHLDNRGPGQSKGQRGRSFRTCLKSFLAIAAV